MTNWFGNYSIDIETSVLVDKVKILFSLVFLLVVYSIKE